MSEQRNPRPNLIPRRCQQPSGDRPNIRCSCFLGSVDARLLAASSETYFSAVSFFFLCIFRQVSVLLASRWLYTLGYTVPSLKTRMYNKIKKKRTGAARGGSRFPFLGAPPAEHKAIASLIRAVIFWEHTAVVVASRESGLPVVALSPPPPPPRRTHYPTEVERAPLPLTPDGCRPACLPTLTGYVS